MPTPSGLPKPGEVWKHQWTLPANDGTGKWKTESHLCTILERSGGAYWAVRVRIHDVPLHQQEQLWVDASWWFTKGDFTYVGKAKPPTKGPIQEVPETHQQGNLSAENLEMLTPEVLRSCDFGLQVAEDGRVWVCVNGIALLRFKPVQS